MEKEELIQIITQWVKVDNEIRELQKQQNIRKIEKKLTTTKILDIMKQNKIDCFEIKGSEISYKQKHSKKCLTKKTLLSIFSSFYDGDNSKVEEINSFIMENRGEKITECIVRKKT